LNPWGDIPEEFKKLKILDVSIAPGELFFLPPYWWYSLQFPNKETVLLSFSYSSIMNVVAHAKHYLNYAKETFSSQS
jgi:hypothetical protein